MAITALPTPPSRQDPDNFAVRADAMMAALVTFVTEANALQADVNGKQASAASDAATATTKAGESASARDIAMAAVHYQGLWSTLYGALNIPASALHSGSVWMLTENVANVAAETPGVSSKWINVTPASGLGSAAYQNSTAFQPAIGALTGLLQSTGGGTISAATAAQIVAAIGAVYVANATHASSADSATSATTIMDGAVSSAAKIANSVITWAKMVTVTAGKLIGSESGGAPSEISIGARLTLSSGVLSADAAPVSSVGGNTGAISNAQIATSAIAGGAASASSLSGYVAKDNGVIGIGSFLVANYNGAGGLASGATTSGANIVESLTGASLALSGTWRNITPVASGSSGASQATTWQRIA